MPSLDQHLHLAVTPDRHRAARARLNAMKVDQGFKLGRKINPGVVSPEFKARLRAFGVPQERAASGTWRTVFAPALAAVALVLAAILAGGGP